MRALSEPTLEKCVNIYQTTPCHIREDGHLHSHCDEDLKSYSWNIVTVILAYKYTRDIYRGTQKYEYTFQQTILNNIPVVQI
jgi:hypothetical protein